MFDQSETVPSVVNQKKKDCSSWLFLIIYLLDTVSVGIIAVYVDYFSLFCVIASDVKRGYDPRWSHLAVHHDYL